MTQEGGTSHLSIVFASVVEGSLREPQVSLINLLREIRIGDIVIVTRRPKFKYNRFGYRAMTAGVLRGSPDRFLLWTPNSIRSVYH